MSDETRNVSQAELDRLRNPHRRIATGPPEVGSSPSEAPADHFDPEVILRDWTPDRARFLWQAPLTLDTRVQTRTRPVPQVSTTERSKFVAVLVLLVALLIAGGLFFAARFLEPADSEEEPQQAGAHSAFNEAVTRSGGTDDV